MKVINSNGNRTFHRDAVKPESLCFRTVCRPLSFDLSRLVFNTKQLLTVYIVAVMYSTTGFYYGIEPPLQPSLSITTSFHLATVIFSNH